MKVILLKNVRGCGVANAVVDVADGYAHNFLLPHKYAVAATPEKMKEMEATKAAREAHEAKEESDLVSKIESLNGKKVTIPARATEKGGLFKGIAAVDISKAIRAEHNLEIKEDAIDLPQPIKSVGEHTAKLSSKSKKVDLGVTITAI